MNKQLCLTKRDQNALCDAINPPNDMVQRSGGLQISTTSVTSIQPASSTWVRMHNTVAGVSCEVSANGICIINSNSIYINGNAGSCDAVRSGSSAVKNESKKKSLLMNSTVNKTTKETSSPSIDADSKVIRNSLNRSSTSRASAKIKTPVAKKASSKQSMSSNVAEKGKENDITCPVCLSHLLQTASSQVMSTTCGHVFCGDCITKVVREKRKCPVCSTKQTLKGLRSIYLP